MILQTYLCWVPVLSVCIESAAIQTWSPCKITTIAVPNPYGGTSTTTQKSAIRYFLLHFVRMAIRTLPRTGRLGSVLLSANVFITRLHDGSKLSGIDAVDRNCNWRNIAIALIGRVLSEMACGC